MTEIRIATTENHFQYISEIAVIIWREHYIPIVGETLVDYMLNKYQSAKAIKQQIESGFEYFLISFKKNLLAIFQ